MADRDADLSAFGRGGVGSPQLFAEQARGTGDILRGERADCTAPRVYQEIAENTGRRFKAGQKPQEGD